MSDQLAFAGMTASDPILHNIYFGLYPDRIAATELAALGDRLCRRHRLSKRPRDQHLLHASLCSVTSGLEISPDLLNGARDAAASVRFPPFRAAFDYVANFGGNAIVLEGHDGSPGLMRLQEHLLTALIRAGIVRGIGPAFNPHVTLIYATKPVVEHVVEPIGWMVRELVLIDSYVGHGLQRVVGRWRLDG